MENLITISIILFLSTNSLFSQSLSWNSIEQTETNQIYLNTAFEYGIIFQAGFAYKVPAVKNLVLITDLSGPLGADLFDDYKFRIGGQYKLYNYKSYKTSIQYHGILKRNETSLVRKLSVGQFISSTTGIYKDGWHLAIEFGYDSSIATHLKHGEFLKSQYEGITDDWFVNTSGQWNYGLQGSKRLGERVELNGSIGILNARGDDDNALLPAYAKIGVVYFFRP